MDNERARRPQFSDQAQLTLWMLVLLAIVFLVVSIVQPAFLSQGNIRNIINQNSVLIIVSMPVTMLMITGNFDLSIGGIIGMGGVLSAWFCQSVEQGGAGLPYWMAVIIALAATTGIGWLNGFLTMRLGVASVIATLGTMSIARGIAYVGASGSMIELGVPKVFRVFGTTEIGSFFTLSMLFMIVAVLVFFFIESKTVFGQKIYLIGANMKAAQLSGVSVRKQINTLFIISGFVSGFAGILLASRLGAGDCKVGLEYEFSAVVAIILGGTSLYGGRGTVVGTVIGVFIIGMIANTLNLFGANTAWQPIVKGLVIVGAILFQRFAMGLRDQRKLRLE
ncbi:MAG: ABC transporter permease [Clostridiales bacterium]|nr:ABC transporter permease [Clostridiales bacterium]